MSDIEVQDPVVQEVQKDEVSPLAEDTTPKQESQVAEEIADLSDERKTIPKDRFDQVWARSKKAEAEAKQLQEELRLEREDRIRLEERTRVQTEQQAQKEMTWAELENGIAEGRWTRDQAQEYKDKMTEQRLERKFKEKQALESSHARVLNEIAVYQQLIPNVMTPGSDERQKYEREYNYLVRNGAPKNYTTELAAVRAAFGDPETIKSRQTSRQVIVNKEPLMETHTSSTPPKTPKKEWKESLSEFEVKHWEKMMKGGIVKDWKGAEEMAKYKPTLRG